MAKPKSAAIQPYTIEEIDRELEKTDAEIKDLQMLVQRRSDLYNLKLLMMRLRTGSVEMAPHTAQSNDRTSKRRPTSDTAYKVLSQRGEMHLNDLITTMHAEGWNGSGDATKDRKAVYVSLHRSPDRFEHAGKKWRAVEQKVLALK